MIRKENKNSIVFHKNHTISKNENKISELTANIIKLNEKTAELLTERQHQQKKTDEKINNLQIKEDALLNELAGLNGEFSNLKSEMILKKNDLNNEILKNKESENHRNMINSKYFHQLSKLDANHYQINCNKQEIENRNLESEYLKKNNLAKRLMNPHSYVYLILKSKPKEISINLKLYKILKNNDYFDMNTI